MNLTKLFETQKALDDRIVKEKDLGGLYLLDAKILALQVELGELANEWRGFKFWSEYQQPITKAVKAPTMSEEDKEYYNPLLEEYVDCLHFILSIGLEHEFDKMLPLEILSLKLGSITSQFTYLLRTDWEIYEEGNAGYYHEGLELFLGLGEMLGFTWDQIETAYYEKNQINHARQSEGY